VPRPLRDLEGTQIQVDAMFGDVGDLWRLDEAGAAVGLDHQPIEDVFLLDRQDLLDGSDALALPIVYRSPHSQGLIGDRAIGIPLSVHGLDVNPRAVWSQGFPTPLPRPRNRQNGYDASAKSDSHHFIFDMANGNP
jgi:hypothetical protein